MGPPRPRRGGPARPRRPTPRFPAALGRDQLGALVGARGHGPAEQDRLAGGAHVERVPRADPVAHVVVGPRRLDHRDGQCLAAVGDGQVRRSPELLGEAAEDPGGQVTQHRVHGAGEVEHGEPELHPAAGVAARQRVALQRGDQPVHHGPVDIQRSGELGDGHPPGMCGEQLEHAQPTVQRLRRFSRHAVTLARSGGRVATRPPRLAHTGPPVSPRGSPSRGSGRCATRAPRRRPARSADHRPHDAARCGWFRAACRCGGARRPPAR